MRTVFNNRDRLVGETAPLDQVLMPKLEAGQPSPPFIPGHEGIGLVTHGVSEVAVGDRVAMPWLGYACGICDYCVSGRETLCLGQEMIGYPAVSVNT